MTYVEASRLALSGRYLQRSIYVMLFVGGILNIINQGEVIMNCGEVEWVKGILTLMVPFCVSTFSAWGGILENNNK